VFPGKEGAMTNGKLKHTKPKATPKKDRKGKRTTQAKRLLTKPASQRGAEG
jgi:hypothetical protein